MISGALNFTLGLQASQFLNAANISTKAVLGLTAAGGALHAAFNKMWAAVEQGGKLTDLAAAASISVKDLYQLQQAFTNVGAAADSVPVIINRLRRTLASGEQNGLLAQLGLDPAALGRMDPAEQFNAVAAAIAKINVNSRAGAAQAIFGREGAQTIQQIANSGSDFADSMNRAKADADVWQKVSATFDTIADQVVELEAHIMTVWANIAGALIQAFREGRLSEALMDIFVSSFEAAFVALPGIATGAFVKLGEALLRVFERVFVYMQTGVDYIVEKLMLGTGSFEELLAANKENIKWNFFGAGLNDIGAYADAQLKSGLAAGGAVLAGLYERLGELSGKLPQGTSPASASGASLNFDKATRTKTDFTDIEKMGGVLLGLGRGFGGDEARQTANNTKQTVDLLNTLNKVQADALSALKSVGLVNI